MADRKAADEETALRIAPGLGNVLFDVWLVSRAVDALINDAIRPSGLDADEYAIYSVLSSGDAMTPTELARWMAAPATTVSSYIKRFERRGHVERVANPDDGRSYRVRLTGEGRRTHTEASTLFRPLLTDVEEVLGDRGAATHDHLQGLHQVIAALRHSA